jgi:CubicO group peptidase (beta-lactamase class C family)
VRFILVSLGAIAKNRLVMSAIFCVFTAGCGGSDSSTVVSPEQTCTATQLEADMDAVLTQTASEVDYSFSLERQDGRRYVFNRGISTLKTSYESASTSKLVSAAIILRLVEQGYLNLSDSPQDHISNWPIPSDDKLFNLTLRHLLSFTSGLTNSPFCINTRNSDFETCVTKIADANIGNGIISGQQFFYASTHLQVAGLMAIKARGFATWQEVFSEFKTQTGLFASAAYDLPSVSNPRLAGGMHWSGEEYMAFLKALKNGLLLNDASMNDLLADHTADATIVYSPTVEGLGEDWHYGFGLWHECQSTVFDCSAGTRVSCPGAYGAYPFWDRNKGYIGILARQGPLGTFPSGIAIEKEVRFIAEEWATCQ